MVYTDGVPTNMPLMPSQRDEIVSPAFDVKSRLAMGYCWVIASRLDVGFSAPVLFSGVLQTIWQLPLERFSDQDPSEKTPDVPKYAVVIEGPSFHGETNRFPSLLQAQIAAESIEVMRDMEPIPNSAELNGLASPAQLSEATRIYIKELSAT